MKEMAMYEFEATPEPVSDIHPEIDAEEEGGAARYTAVVLAGSRSNSDPVASAFGSRHKALVPICGTPMIARVVKALRGAQSVKRIVIVFDDEQELFEACPQFQSNECDTRVDVVPCSGSICGSVASALDACGEEWPFLVTTADHALLTSTMVDRFCFGVNQGAKLAVGFVERKYIDAAHPGSKRTYLPFRETQLSGANLFAFTDEGALPVLDFWRQIEMKRKKPWQLFRAFGYRNLFGLLMKRFTVDEAFERASKVLGVKACAVRLPFAEAAIDVDTPKDYEQVTQILEGRISGTVQPENPLQPVA
ncbi:MAG: NTP transferase domain-containing protein [Alphaproteobacteria bacterium]|nr:NTP transferase domain-containing protein [Alphaproteobacteria bacterium]